MKDRNKEYDCGTSELKPMKYKLQTRFIKEAESIVMPMSSCAVMSALSTE